MYDTLLSRYGDISFIMNLPYYEGIALYQKAVEKDFESSVWDRWLVDYGRMNDENFQSYADYLKKFKQSPRPEDTRSDDEIIQDAENILKSMKRS